VWRETTEWRHRYKAPLDDLRHALDWCFGIGGGETLSLVDVLERGSDRQ
jgi:hypothetical protein